MRLDTDFLIIGSGLAGLNAALHLTPYGSVLLASKDPAGDGATAHAQGGMASVMLESDSFASHTADTLAAGAGLCHQDVVASIVEEGPQAVASLAALGVAFDRNGHGQGYDLTREGGHRARRIVHVRDTTGHAITQVLRRKVATRDTVRIWDHHIAVDLITRGQRDPWVRVRDGDGRREDPCIGAYILDCHTGQVETIRAKATLVATGGAGKVYLYTSNPHGSTGDGVAMAFRAGACVANMEFFQFHPTCLVHPQATSFLISEALRGEGGVLRRHDGTALMEGAHPMQDLAPRDVVAQAMDAELKRSGAAYLTLDMTHLDADYLIHRFPYIHATCLGLGIDMTRQAIPVVPAAHYMCGGIVTNARGATTLAGLWAAGETACTGLHGANRLASNALLEATVVSKRAAQDMARYAERADVLMPAPAWDPPLQRPGSPPDPNPSAELCHAWDDVRRTMWDCAGIVRSDPRLHEAAQRLARLQEKIQATPPSLQATRQGIELRNLLLVAQLIVACAQRRRESRGLHINTDTPQPAEAWRRDTCVHCEVPCGAHRGMPCDPDLHWVWSEPTRVFATRAFD